MKVSFGAMLKNLTLTLITVLLFGANFLVNAQQAALGKVTGQVFDQQDAIILGNEVVIENQNFRKSVMPNPDDGKYTFEVPPGIYTVTTKQGTWYSVKRAAFSVQANETTVINISPTIRVKAIFLEVTSKGIREPVEYNRESKYEELLPFPDLPFNVVIEYSKRKSNGSVTEYRNAKLTYNNLSVFADILRFDKNKLLVEAKGNVTVDENGQRQKKQNANLQIVKVAERK